MCSCVSLPRQRIPTGEEDMSSVFSASGIDFSSTRASPDGEGRAHFRRFYCQSGESHPTL